MTRILFSLASLSIILLITAMVLGLGIGDLYLRPMPDQQTLRWATVHRLTGVAAALAVVFVESVIVTYFIGTSRWCREVVETYQLDAALVGASNRLKRKTFPLAMLGMLTVVGIVALGGAADPATGRENTQLWANWHLIGAMAGIAFIGWTYLAASNNIHANSLIIQEIVAQVDRIRRERGLDGADPSLAAAHDEPAAVR